MMKVFLEMPPPNHSFLQASTVESTWDVPPSTMTVKVQKITNWSLMHGLSHLLVEITLGEVSVSEMSKFYVSLDNSQATFQKCLNGNI